MRLDPRAEEFWPSAAAAAVPRSATDHFQVVHPPIYFPYPSHGMLTPLPGPPKPAQSAASAVCTGATRAVVLSPVPGHVTEEAVRRDMEAFGAVRAVQVVERRKASPALSPAGTAAAEVEVEEMVVVVQFYDVRDAQQAVLEVQAQHMRQQSRLGHRYSLLMRNWCPPEELFLGFPPPPLPASAVQERGLVDGRAVWAQFTTATRVGGVEGQNQGTIVVFNVDSDIPSDHLSDIFQAFGKSLHSCIKCKSKP